MQQNKSKQEFILQPSSTKNVNKINMVEVKNEGMIHDACYDFYGSKIALGSSDGFIEIQENNLNSFKSDQKEIISYKINDFQHKGPVWQLSWSNPKYGSILASCSFDKTICLFKEQKFGRYSKLLQFTESQESVQTIAWSYKKFILAAGVADGSVHLYYRQKEGNISKESDWKHIQQMKHQSCVNQVSWVRDKDLDFASCSNDKTIIIWQVKNLEGIAELKQKTIIHCNSWVRSVDWAAEPFKQFYLLAAGVESNQVNIYYLDSDYKEMDVYTIHTKGPCWKVQWSPLGNQIAICTLDEKNDPFVGVFRQVQSGDFIEI